jgi:hypothetical protein
MKTRIAILVGAAALGTLLTAPPANAANPIQFGKIQYDSPGSDTGANASINAEYVIIRNTSTRTVALTGWTVRDALPTVYKFGTFSLGAGKTVVLRTGKGTNSATTRYWGMSRYVWNNPGDMAILRNAAGATMDTCAWSKIGVGSLACP